MTLFIIYCLTCVLTGKKYVGQTKRTLERRWSGHVNFALKGRDNCRVLARAIRKYGPDAFSRVVLEVVATRDLADLAEMKWIAELNTVVPNGYNLDSGGWGGHGTGVESKARNSAAKKAWWSKLTANERREHHARSNAHWTPEKRSKVHIAIQAKKTPEERRANVLKGWASRTDEQRAEFSKLGLQAQRSPDVMEAKKASLRAAWTPEKREAARLKSVALRASESPEKKKESQRKRLETLSPERRKEIAQKGLAAKTPEARSEYMRRAWVTRRTAKEERQRS